MRLQQLFLNLVHLRSTVVVAFFPCQVFSFAAQLSPQSSFVHDVTSWLNDECVGWEPLLENDHRCLLQLEDTVRLHLLPSPRSLEEAVSPRLAYDMTNEVSANNQTILPVIHLHQDVWQCQRDIVQSRLLQRVGRVRRRMFARQTVARRIDRTAASPFLESHHLWSAVTSAKYAYGLYYQNNDNGAKQTKDQVESEEGVLVAVATFGSCRRVLRRGVVHKSHELVRFCSRRGESVVGAISKLLKAFIRDVEPDDIVTIIDRDWGGGEGWNGLGFETVAIMPPLVMVVAFDRRTGTSFQRHHLVGAGISIGNDDTNRAVSGRPKRVGLPLQVWEALDETQNTDEAFACLSEHEFYPVYDTGVERLCYLVPESNASRQHHGTESLSSAIELWQDSTPSYVASYYSSNNGISSLLRHCEGECSRSPDA